MPKVKIIKVPKYPDGGNMKKTRVKITGLPKAAMGMNVNNTLPGTDRSNANVEAEKGETVFTNMSGDDMVEHYNIGGKKHGEGGTPLELDVNSYIFSDRLKIKDRKILEFFNEKGKNKTIADIAKKYNLNEYKRILQDDDADRLAKKTAELNMNNAVEKLSALAIYQESLKGMPQGTAKIFTPFMEKTKMTIDDMLPTKALTAGITRPQPQMKFGGELPKYWGGGVWKDDGDATAKAQFVYIKDKLQNNADFKKALKAEYDKAFDDKTNFNTEFWNKRNKIKRKTEEEVFTDFIEFQERNLIFKHHGKKVDETAQSPYRKNGVLQTSNQELEKWADELGVKMPKRDDAAAQQLSFIAFANLVDKQGSEYKDKLGDVLKPFQKKLYGAQGEKNVSTLESSGISLVDGAYTNTSAGETSFFEPNKIEVKTNDKGKIEVDVKDEPSTYVPVKPTVPTIQTARGFMPAPFWTQDINNINRALASKLAINKYSNFVPGTNLQQADSAYYSPERAIAAINQQVQTGVDSSETFSGPQQQAANFAQMQGQAMAQVADTIGNYADKNVGIFNQTEQYNTQLANQKAMQDAAMQKAAHDERVTLNQNYDNAIQAAKDKIVSTYNAALTNRGETQAMNLLTPQYAVDPITGLTYFKPGAPLTPSTSGSTDLGSEFAELKKQMPNVSDETIAKMVIGKQTVEKDDGIITPDDLNKNNLG